LLQAHISIANNTRIYSFRHTGQEEEEEEGKEKGKSISSTFARAVATPSYYYWKNVAKKM